MLERGYPETLKTIEDAIEGSHLIEAKLCNLSIYIVSHRAEAYWMTFVELIYFETLLAKQSLTAISRCNLI